MALPWQYHNTITPISHQYHNNITAISQPKYDDERWPFDQSDVALVHSISQQYHNLSAIMYVGLLINKMLS